MLRYFKPPHKSFKTNLRASSALHKAFSLVEISIAILVIGILIAGVSRGLDLYQDFRLAQARQLTKNSIVGRMNGLTLWLETTSENSFDKPTPDHNQPIAKWKNINFQTNNQLDLSQTDTQFQPKYIVNAINNLPALNFNDGIKYLSTDPINFTDVSGPKNVSIFFAIRSISDINPGAGNTMSYNEKDANNVDGFGMQIYFFHKYLSFDTNIKFYFGSKLVGGCNLVFGTNGGPGQYNKCGNTISYNFTDYMNKNFIFALTKNENIGKIYVNGAVNITNESFTFEYPQNNLKANLYVGTPLRSSLNYIGEIIMFNRSLSDKEINNVHEYLKNKWKI